MPATNVLSLCFVLSCIKVLQGLRCYSCNDAESEEDCNWRTERCSIDQGACFTEIRNFGNSVRLKKSCYQTHACRNLHQQIGHECPRVCTLCCTGELCNTAAPKACSCNLATEAPKRTKPTTKTPVLKRWRNRARQIRRQRNRTRKTRKTTSTTITTNMSTQSTVKTSTVISRIGPQLPITNTKKDSAISATKSNLVASPTLYKSSIMSYLSKEANMSRPTSATMMMAITTESEAGASTRQQLSTTVLYAPSKTPARTTRVQDNRGAMPRVVVTTSFSTMKGSRASNEFMTTAKSEENHNKYTPSTATQGPFIRMILSAKSNSSTALVGTANARFQSMDASTSTSHASATMETTQHGDKSDMDQDTTIVLATEPFESTEENTPVNPETAETTRHEEIYQDATPMAATQSSDAIEPSTPSEYEAMESTQYRSKQEIYQDSTQMSVTRPSESIKQSTPLDPVGTEATQHESKSDMYQDSTPMASSLSSESMEAGTPSEYEATETTQYRTKQEMYHYSTPVSATRSYETMKISTSSHPQTTETTQHEITSDMYQDSTPMDTARPYEPMKGNTPLDLDATETTQHEGKLEMYHTTPMAATQSYESTNENTPLDPDVTETTQHEDTSDMYQDSTPMAFTRSYKSTKERTTINPDAKDTTQHEGTSDMYLGSIQVSATQSYESMKESIPLDLEVNETTQHEGKSKVYHTTPMAATQFYESTSESTPSEPEVTETTQHEGTSDTYQDSTPIAATLSYESMTESTSSESEAREITQNDSESDIDRVSTQSSATRSYKSMKESTSLNAKATETTQYQDAPDMYQYSTQMYATQSPESMEASTPSEYDATRTTTHYDRSGLHQVVTTQDSATASIVSAKTSKSIGFTVSTAMAQVGGKRALYNDSRDLATQASKEPVVQTHSAPPSESSVNPSTSNATSPDKVTLSLAEDAFLTITSRDRNPSQASELILAPPCDRKTFVPLQRNNTNLMSCRRSAHTNMAMICSVDFDISRPRPFEEFNLFIDKNGSATEFAYHQCRTQAQGNTTAVESPRILCINMTSKLNIVRFRRKQLLARVLQANDTNYNLECEFKYFATLKETNDGFNSRNASAEESIFPFEFKAVKRLQTFCGKRLFGIHCEFSPEPTTAPAKVKAGSIPWRVPVINMAVVASVILGIVIIMGLVRKKGFYLVRRKVKPNKTDNK